ncbi:hypothetical protein CR513_09525, partial [Mucuna pruriens]
MFCERSLKDSEEWIPHVEFSYNWVFNTTTSYSAFELAYGFNPFSLLDLFPLPIFPNFDNDEGLFKAQFVQKLHDKVRLHMERKGEKYVRSANKRRKEVLFKELTKREVLFCSSNWSPDEVNSVDEVVSIKRILSKPTPPQTDEADSISKSQVQDMCRLRLQVSNRSSGHKTKVWVAADCQEGIVTILAKSESSVAYNTKIWTSQEHAGSESSQLSIAGSKIPGTNVPPTTATTNTTMRKFFYNGGFDFTISTEYNCYYT